MRANVELVTPAMARQWLDHPLTKGRQRPLNQTLVDKYTDLMNRKLWFGQNGETMIIANDGGMLDGQHRCHAITKTGVPVMMLVARGVDPEAFKTINRAATRTTPQLLAIAGEGTASSALSSALAFVWRYKNNLMTATRAPDPQDVFLLLEAEPGIRHSATAAKSHKKLFKSSGLPIAMHYLFSKVDDTACDAFFDSLRTGAGLALTSPVYHLRERLTKNMLVREGTLDRHATRQLTSTEIAALTIKAFNMFRRDESCRLLAWHNRGNRAEEFPLIKGLRQR